MSATPTTSEKRTGAERSAESVAGAVVPVSSESRSMQAKPSRPATSCPSAASTSAENLKGLAVERHTRATPSAGRASSTCLATAVCGSTR